MTKIVSLADDAYDYLKSLKNEDESFSEVVRRLAPKKDPRGLLKLAGCLKDESFYKAMDEILKERRTIKFKTPKF